MISHELLLIEGDFRGRIPEIARRYGQHATGRTWPEDEIPDDIDDDEDCWLVTWFVKGWTVLSVSGWDSGTLNDPDLTRAVSAELATRVALVEYVSTTDLEVFHLFDRGALVRRFAHDGGGQFPTEEAGTPLCRSSEPEPHFAEGSLFAAMDALLGFSSDDLLSFEPKTSFECVESSE